MQRKYKSYLPLNLQLFADNDDDIDDDPEDNGDKEPQKKGDGKVTFTPEQQAELDRILAKTIAKERAKREKEIEAAKTEAEKLAKMNAEQKAEYERQQQEEALAKREREISRRELRATALEQLADRGLPKQLADILVYTDADSTNESLKAVEQAFRTSVEQGVNERLKGEPPKGKGKTGEGVTNPWKKETFNMTEQGRILREDPALAKQLKLAAGIKN